MTLVSTYSSARVKRCTVRLGIARAAQNASISSASCGRAARSLATVSVSRSSMPTSMLETEADALAIAVGLGGEPGRQPADHDGGEPGELCRVGQQLLVARRGGAGHQRLAAILGRHVEPVLVERHGDACR